MSRETQAARFSRMLRTMLYLFQHGATPAELARFTNSTERTAHRDIRILRNTGLQVTCHQGIYRIPCLPDLPKLDDADEPRLPQSFRNSIFRRWYKPHARNNIWYVVRADKPDSKGTQVGPVQISGTNYYLKALALAKQRNAEILEKRNQTVIKMLDAGWTHDQINQFREQALQYAKKDLGNDKYTERDP